MDINFVKRIIVIGVIGIVICVAYLCGFYAENKISFSNSESEIVAEEVDLTEEVEDDIIIVEEEIAEPICSNEIESEIEIPNPIYDDDFEIEGRTHFEIIEEELMQTVDVCKMIDSYEDGNWYAYYVCADGDIYVITLKNNAVDVCCQLN